MITGDMTRLRDEILAMRRGRGRLMSDLQHDAKSRKKAVTQLCSRFGHARTKMAKRTKDVRLVFLNNLKRSVGAQRQDMRNDLAGARTAWAGKSS
jgi:hypothetical protein